MKPVWLKPMEAWNQFAKIKESLEHERGFTCINGISETQKSHLVASILEPLERDCIFISHNDYQARKVFEDFNTFHPDRVAYYPARDIVLYNAAAYSSGLKSQRLSVLSGIASGEKKIIVTSIEALMLPLSSPERFRESIISIAVGDVYSLQDLIVKIVDMGYERVRSVEGIGQFSVRGGILDIFPLSSDRPWRIEFFDEEVDSIRSFDPVTQRSLDKAQKVVISPAGEFLPTRDELEKGKAAIRRSLTNYINKMKSKGIRKGHSAIKADVSGSDFDTDGDEGPSKGSDFVEAGDIKKESAPNKVTDKGFDPERLQQKIEEVIEGIENNTLQDSVYNYYPLISDRLYTLIDYLCSDTLIVIDEPTRVAERGLNYKNEFDSHFKDLLVSSEVLPEQANLLVDKELIFNRLSDFSGLVLQSLPRGQTIIAPKMIFQLSTRSIPSYQGKPNLLAEDIRYWKSRGCFVLLLTGTQLRAHGLQKTLRDYGVETQVRIDGDLSPEAQGKQDSQVIIYPGSLSRGFEYVDAHFVVVSDNEIFGLQKHKTRVKKRSRKLDPFTDLKVGDLVVHENHGIGRYLGIEKLTVNGQVRDYLNVQYAGTDRLYIPTDQMDLIQPYIGIDDRPPKLSKLGGSEWQKAKSKARSSVKDIAEDLLKLYAARESATGYQFSPDTDWQRTFEDMFPYEETPDQLQSIEEIKRDMESTKVMDRLLCGDVGYGKTEVAIRAAFKAVTDGKQVAFLAPTTILAHQHYNTFVSRFGDFPFKIEVISRFRTPAEQKRILKELKEGNVDVIIGTHRLLSKDVAFKDLGLLIIDEEQRFGVAHKESIKNLKKNIDVLTLTATPIPRTLHMSLTGIRDISVIETPPEERFPVQTYVVEYNESMIRDAILRELKRSGQVYYVYNYVKTMDKMARRLRELVPEARIATAHGQMSERMLENIMLKFYEQEFDVLVCSTIIENGLDIPNVNTIIVHDADHFGLSQLYQLRGRVGRSNRIAYAYFTYRKDKILNETAEKRLRAIKEFTEFGSGFKIAMRDLEIRGSGNLLGAEQHGHMSAVGYELYTKMLHEAIQEMKGKPVEKPVETVVDIKVDAYIDRDYITGEGNRIEIYKRIAAIESLNDRYDVEDELEDRFGQIPECTQNLIYIAYIKALAKGLKVADVTHRNREVRIRFAGAKALKPETVMVIINEDRNRIRLSLTDPPVLTLKLSATDEGSVLKETIKILERLTELQKSLPNEQEDKKSGASK